MGLRQRTIEIEKAALEVRKRAKVMRGNYLSVCSESREICRQVCLELDLQVDPEFILKMLSGANYELSPKQFGRKAQLSLDLC